MRKRLALGAGGLALLAGWAIALSGGSSTPRGVPFVVHGHSGALVYEVTVTDSISGEAKEGQVLTAVKSCNHEPCTFAYKWLRCNSGGTSCSAIGGATSSTYTLVSGDVGHTIRLEATGTGPNGAISGVKESSATAEVTGSGSGINPNLSAENCFDNPEVELEATTIGGCGYAEPHNVGVVRTAEQHECRDMEEGGSLTLYGGSLTVKTSGSPYVGKLFKINLGKKQNGDAKPGEPTEGGSYDEGSLRPESNVTIEGSCVIVENPNRTNYSAIYTGNNTGFLFKNSTMRAPAAAVGAQEYMQEGIGTNGSGGFTVEHSRLENCVECGNASLGGEVTQTYKESFLLADGERPLGKWASSTAYSVGQIVEYCPSGCELWVVRKAMSSGEDVAPELNKTSTFWWAIGGPHQEDVYANEGIVKAELSTIFSPVPNTAIVFQNTGSGSPSGLHCVSKDTFIEDFIAGAQNEIQLCGKKGEGELAGTGKLVAKKNRWARCTKAPITSGRCSGTTGYEGGDTAGYFSKGGSEHVFSTELTGGEREEEGNFWDNNHAEVKSTE